MFTPVVPMSGLAGWNFLQSTQQRQQDIFNQSPQLARDLDKAAQDLPNIRSVDALLDNRSALRVVLGAFDLESDINNRYFLKKMMTSDSADPKSLANRMSDQRYKDLAKAMSSLVQFGQLRQSTIAEITRDFSTTSFEVAVGQQDNTLRLAMNATRELQELAQSDKSDKAMWYTVLGIPPLRKVFETYLRLPSGFAKIDLEKQVDMMQDKLQARTGSAKISQFSDPAKTDKFVQMFIVQSQVNTGPTLSGGSTALMLLQQG